MYCRFCRCIGRKTTNRLPPAVGAQVDDRSAAGRNHAGGHGLHGKKEMAQIGVQPVIPVLRRHIFPIVAVIARRIVDEHGGSCQAWPATQRMLFSARRYRGDRKSHRRSSPPSSSASAALAGRSRSIKPTFAPWAEKPCTISAPMPDAPPVTKTVFPARLG